MSGKALIIESIAKSAERLIAENRRLRAEVEKAGAAREKLRSENRRLAAEKAEIERRLAVKELAAGFAGGPLVNGVAAVKGGPVVNGGSAVNGATGGKTGAGVTVDGVNTGAATVSEVDRHGVKLARARVNRLMREVDKCIALLNRD